MCKKILLCFLFCELFKLSPLYAYTTQTSFKVHSSIPKICTISTSPFNFGRYTGNENLRVAQPSITVTCTHGTEYSVGLMDPNHLQGNPNHSYTATLQANTPTAAYLKYHIYQDAGYHIPWGHQVGVDTSPGIGTGHSQVFILYGEVPKNQPTSASGTYTATLNVSITY